MNALPPAAITRIGVGTDLHRLESGKPLLLGGVRVPHTHGLIGHSDADVVLHAVADALLGAAGLPDIGEQFPDTDPVHAGADSGELLQRVAALVALKGFAVAYVDLVIQAERPRLVGHKPAIRDRIARLLSIVPQRVNVKAKTNEGVDAIGRGEAIGCIAVAGLSSTAG